MKENKSSDIPHGHFKKKQQNYEGSENALFRGSLKQSLERKLFVYHSETWRADLYHSSPIWTETPEESTHAFISCLFDPGEIIWMGLPFDSGKPENSNHFKTCREWMKMPSLPPRIAAGLFKPGSISRSKTQVIGSPFIVIESDDLIGKKPETDSERQANKAMSYALARYCQDKLGLILRAVVDTGNKSLHLWFDHPGGRALSAIVELAPGLHIDVGLLESCATAPLRMPGCVHEKTKKPATLLYLSDAVS